MVDILCIAFDESEKYIAVSSNTTSVHVFCLKYNNLYSTNLSTTKTTYALGFYESVIYKSCIVSAPYGRPYVCFGKEYTAGKEPKHLYVISEDCVMYKFDIDFESGKIDKPSDERPFMPDVF